MPYLAQGLAWRTESVRVGGDGASGSGVDHPRVLKSGRQVGAGRARHGLVVTFPTTEAWQSQNCGSVSQSGPD